MSNTKRDKVEHYGTRADGFEYPDPTPVEIPTRLRLPQRQVDRVRDIVRRELSLQAQDEGFESFDEADDFDLEGEEPVSPYELQFEPAGVPDEEVPAPGPKVKPKKVPLAKHAAKKDNSSDVPPEPDADSKETGPAEPA